MEGWIKLYRRFLKWEWYQDGNTVRVFLHLLLTANYEDKRWEGIPIKRGQVLTGRVKLAKALGLTQDQIRTAIKHLKSTNEITTSVTRKYSLITICKFEDYQAELSKESPDKSPDTSPRDPHDIPTTKNKEEGEEYPPISPQGDEPEVKKKENPTLTPEESLDYLPDEYLTEKFKEAWIAWWKYRKSERWTTRLSYANSSVRDLEKLAGGNVHTARKIVEQSMAKGWHGLFALKGDDAPRRPKHGTRDGHGEYHKPKYYEN